VAINAIIQVLAYALLGHFYLTQLPNWLGLNRQTIHVSTLEIAKAVAIVLGIPLIVRLWQPQAGGWLKGIALV